MTRNVNAVHGQLSALPGRPWHTSDVSPTRPLAGWGWREDIDLLCQETHRVDSLVDMVKQCLTIEVLEDGVRFDPAAAVRVGKGSAVAGLPRVVERLRARWWVMEDSNLQPMD